MNRTRQEFIDLHYHHFCGLLLDAVTHSRTGGELSLWLKMAQNKITDRLGKGYDDLTKPRKGQHETNGQPTTDNGSEARQSDPEGHPGDTLPSHR